MTFGAGNVSKLCVYDIFNLSLTLYSLCIEMKFWWTEMPYYVSKYCDKNQSYKNKNWDKNYMNGNYIKELEYNYSLSDKIFHTCRLLIWIFYKDKLYTHTQTHTYSFIYNIIYIVLDSIFWMFL